MHQLIMFEPSIQNAGCDAPADYVSLPYRTLGVMHELIMSEAGVDLEDRSRFVLLDCKNISGIDSVMRRDRDLVNVEKVTDQIVQRAKEVLLRFKLTTTRFRTTSTTSYTNG